MEAELARAEGSVAAVVFQNHDNGYTVARLKVDRGEQITIVGTLPQTAVGERLRVEGVWTEHSTYGRQLELRAVERVLPESRIGILAYLSSRTIRGVGPKLAARIVDRFGERSLEVIEHEHEQLAQITGISPAKAKEIHESFLSQQGLRLLAEFLGRYQLPVDLAVRIYREHGELSLAAIEDDPYCLTTDGVGVSFAQVDRFALEMGVDSADERRVDAGILYELRFNSTGGHVFLPQETLVSVTADFLHLDREVIREGLQRLFERGRVTLETVAGIEAVYLPQFARAERFLAERFLSMANSAARLPANLSRTVAEIEAEQEIEYAELQRHAIYAAASERLLLITGGPGTGKTTILKGILGLFDRQRIKTLLAAPTGRAAKRLTELTGRDASTIHRLLEVDVTGGDGEDMIFLHNEHNPLTCDAVIVD